MKYQTKTILFSVFSVMSVASCTNELPKFDGKSESLRKVVLDAKTSDRGIGLSELADAIAVMTQGAVTVDSVSGEILTESTGYSSRALYNMTAEQVVATAKTEESLARFSDRSSAYFKVPLGTGCNWFVTKADEGKSFAQVEVARWYTTGDMCVSKNEEKATKLFLAAANNGSIVAQRIMGYRYQDGDGVVKDKKQSKYWFGMAASSGDMDQGFRTRTS